MHVLSLNAIRLYSTVVLVAGLVTVSAAQTLPVIPASRPLDERSMVAAEVFAPRIVVGVMLETGVRSLSPGVATVFPQEWSGSTVCARFLSSDSLYEADSEHVVPQITEPLLAALEFRTQKTRKLSQLGRNDLAVTISRGGCENEVREFVPAIWRAEAPKLADPVLIYVGAQGATDVYANINSGSIESEVQCEVLSNDETVGFDHVCKIPTEQFPQGGRIDIELNRVNAGAFDPPELFTLWLRSSN